MEFPHSTDIIEKSLGSPDVAVGPPRLRRRALARNAIWNLIGGTLPLVVAVIAIPIALHGFGTVRFGVLTLAWILVGYFSLFDFGVGRAMTQAVAHAIGSGEEKGLPAVFGSSLFMLCALGILAGSLCFVVAPVVCHQVLHVPLAMRDDTIAAFKIMAATIPLVIVSTGLRGYLEAYQKFAVTNLVRAPLAAATYVAPLLVLPFSKYLTPVFALLALSRLIALVAYGVMCLRLDSSLRMASINRKAIARIMAFGSWMSVSNFVSPIIVYMDRFVIAAAMPIAVIAYYTTPFEAVTRLFVVSSAVGGVLFPAFATSFVWDRHWAAELFDRASKYLLITLFPVLLISSLFATELLTLWIDRDFAERAGRVLALLSTGVLANGLAQVPFALVQGAGRPAWTAKLHVAELLAYLPLLVGALASHGVEGAAFVWMLRATIDYLALVMMSARLLRSTGAIPWRRYLTAPAAVFCLALVAELSAPLVARLLLGIPSVVVALLMAWFVLLSPNERATGLSVIGLGRSGPKAMS